MRDEVAVPQPAVDEVLVEVAACGINNTDINTRQGWYSPSVTEPTDAGPTSPGATPEEAVDAPSATWHREGFAFPRIQGADVCGSVVASGGPEGEHLVGERVLVDPWVRDPATPGDRSLARYLGSELDGGFAEFCAVPARNVHPVESMLTDAELATIPCSWSTAEHMLQRIPLEPGETIVVTGASGGVGSALVQLANLRGVQVIAVAGADKATRVEALGARVVPRGPDTPARAREVAAGTIDAVADVVGGPDVPGWLEAIRPGGSFVTSGAIAGPMVELDLRTLYLRDLDMVGATVVPEGVFADVVAHLESGRVKPVLAATWPLEEIHEAQEAFGAKKHVGALAVTL